MKQGSYALGDCTNYFNLKLAVTCLPIKTSDCYDYYIRVHRTNYLATSQRKKRAANSAQITGGQCRATCGACARHARGPSRDAAVSGGPRGRTGRHARCGTYLWRRTRNVCTRRRNGRYCRQTGIGWRSQQPAVGWGPRIAAGGRESWLASGPAAKPCAAPGERQKFNWKFEMSHEIVTK